MHHANCDLGRRARERDEEEVKPETAKDWIMLIMLYKNECLQKYSRLKYFTLIDQHEIERHWSEAECRLIIGMMGVSDAGSCVWCLRGEIKSSILSDAKLWDAEIDCDQCGYGMRHGKCLENEQLFRGTMMLPAYKRIVACLPTNMGKYNCSRSLTNKNIMPKLDSLIKKAQQAVGWVKDDRREIEHNLAFFVRLTFI